MRNGYRIFLAALLLVAFAASGYSCYQLQNERAHYQKMGEPVTMPADFYAEKAAWEGKPAPTQ
jgi:hypothetical protein